jgi:hypothetical protein
MKQKIQTVADALVGLSLVVIFFIMSIFDPDTWKKTVEDKPDEL